MKFKDLHQKVTNFLKKLLRMMDKWEEVWRKNVENFTKSEMNCKN